MKSNAHQKSEVSLEVTWRVTCRMLLDEKGDRDVSMHLTGYPTNGQVQIYGRRGQNQASALTEVTRRWLELPWHSVSCQTL